MTHPPSPATRSTRRSARRATALLLPCALLGCGAGQTATDVPVTAVKKSPLASPGGHNPAPTPLASPPSQPVTPNADPPVAELPKDDADQESSPAPNVEAQAAPLPRSCKGLAPSRAPATTLAEGCYPEADYVKRLCARAKPSVALVMFSKDSPWVRAYMLGPGKAWTTSPGGQNEEQLFFREELLVLQGPGADDGDVAVSQGASFYALRWDGTCVKLTEEEVTLTPPWQKASPPVRWEWLDDSHQAVLRQEKPIRARVAQLKKDCRATRLSKATEQCTRARAQVTEAITAFVRSGGQLPDPEARP